MKNFVPIVIMILTSSAFFAQVGINTTTPDASAILEITSSDKGILTPRIVLTSTLVEAPVTNPAMGLLIFNTATAGSGDNAVTPGFYYWDDDQSEWMRFTSGEQGNHYVGELYGGGVVFYVYENGTHGLIASFDDLDGGSGAAWGPNYTDTDSESWWDGATNMTTAVANGPAGTDAVKLCDDYSSDGFTDWHLPSIGGLKALEDAAYVLFKVLDSDGDASTNAPDYASRYWSSTTNGNLDAYAFAFIKTHTEIQTRTNLYKVRAVRSF